MSFTSKWDTNETAFLWYSIFYRLKQSDLCVLNKFCINIKLQRFEVSIFKKQIYMYIF